MFKEIFMKRFLAVFMVCFFVFCGCLSVDDSAATGGGAPGGGGNAPGAGTSGGASDPASLGVIFEWDSAKTPLTAAITAGNPVATGYGNVNFRVIGGRSIMTTEDGALRLGADNRLVIGGTNNQSTGADSHSPGVFNISRGVYRLTLDYKDPEGGGDGNYLLRLFINNNHTAQASSVLGAGSNIGQFTDTGQLFGGNPHGGLKPGTTCAAEPNRVILTVNPQVTYATGVSNYGKTSLETAFFCLNCQGISRITITAIKIERIE